MKMPNQCVITEARHSPMLFAGLGSRIFVANKRPYSAQASSALVYDTETAAMSLGPRLPENLCCLFVAADADAAAGDGEKKKKKKKKKKARREQETVLYMLSTVDHGGRSQHPSGHLLGVSVHALSAPAAGRSGPGRASRRPLHRSTATRRRSSPTRCTRTGAPYSSPREIGRGAAEAPTPSTRSAASGGRTGSGSCPSCKRATSRESWTHGSGSTRTATSAPARPPARPRRRSGRRRRTSCSARETRSGTWGPRSPTWATMPSALWRA